MISFLETIVINMLVSARISDRFVVGLELGKGGVDGIGEVLGVLGLVGAELALGFGEGGLLGLIGGLSVGEFTTRH